MKFRLVEEFNDVLLEDNTSSKLDPEKKQQIIDDITNTTRSYMEIANARNVHLSTVKRLGSKLKNRQSDKYYVYLGTMNADFKHIINDHKITGDIEFLPSVYLGYYGSSKIQAIYDYIKNEYMNHNVTNLNLLKFYFRIANGDISLDTLKFEIESLKNSNKGYQPPSTHQFIIVSENELTKPDIAEFKVDDYRQTASEILTLLNRSKYSDSYTDLKALAAKLAPKTADALDKINKYVEDNLTNVAEHIYSQGQEVKPTDDNYIEPTNPKYKNRIIPYEEDYDIQYETEDTPLEQVGNIIEKYKRYLLYGFMDNSEKIVYIGISVRASGRGEFYKNERRDHILQAFKDKLIKKLIIFKSDFPINNTSTTTSLLYALEVYFAEELFKTYPGKYPTALNFEKPGKNSSAVVAQNKLLAFELFLDHQEKLLSYDDFMSNAKKILKVVSVKNTYSYGKYALNYIENHNGNISKEDKQTLHQSLSGDSRRILWDLVSSEKEFKEITGYKTSDQGFKNWINYRDENNLLITEDLDDDIDMEYYV